MVVECDHCLEEFIVEQPCRMVQCPICGALVCTTCGLH